MEPTYMDILYRINDHLDADPALYTRLACVNKNWYRAFTSDKVWAPLDVYGVKTGIFRKFLDSFDGSHELALLKRLWKAPIPWTSQRVKETFKSKYMWLAHILQFKTSFNSEELDDFRDERPLLLCVLQLDGFMIQEPAPEWFRNTKEYALQAVKFMGHVLQCLPAKWQDDKDVVLTAISSKPGRRGAQRYTVYQLASPRLQLDADVISTALEHDPDVLGCVPPALQPYLSQDPRWMAELMRNNPENYSRPHAEKDNFDYLLAAVQGHEGYKALKHAPRALLNNRRIAMAAVQADGRALKHLPTQFRADKEIVMAALGSWPQESDMFGGRYDDEKGSTGLPTFIHASLFDDRDIIKKVVRVRSEYLKLFPAFQNDAGVVIEALQDPTPSLELVGRTLLHDKDFALEALNITAVRYVQLPNRLKGNREIVRKVLEDPYAAVFMFPHIPQNLKEDVELAKVAVSSNAGLLAQLPRKLQSNKQVVHAAAAKNGDAVTNANPRFLDDLETAKIAVKTTPSSIQYFKPTIQRNRDILRLAMADATHWVLQNKPDLVDEELCLLAVSHRIEAFMNVPENLRHDFGFIKKAVKAQPELLVYLPERLASQLKNEPEVLYKS